MKRSCAKTRICAGLALGLVACAPDDSLPKLPEGAEHVLQVADLEVYKVFEGALCAGTLRRIELYTLGLAELFDMDPPRARLLLFPDSGSIMEACNGPAWGCAGRRSAQAMPSTATHELAHVFVINATDGALPPAGMREGLAWALEDHLAGPPHPPVPKLEDLEEALIVPLHPLQVPRELPRNVFAWLLHRHGIEATLDVYVEAAGAEGDILDAIAVRLGYGSAEGLHADYAETYAWYYPPLVETAQAFGAADLEGGVSIDLSCTGPITEGPSDWRRPEPREGELRFEAHVEFPLRGLYQMGDAFPFEDFSLLLRPTAPSFDVSDGVGRPPHECPDPPRRILVRNPGTYQLLTRQPLDTMWQTNFSAHYLGYAEVCPEWEN